MHVQITYLDNSGFALKTEQHFLIFDYYNNSPTNGMRGLAGGVIDPKEIAQENVVVFASHAHMDHYNPVILEWEKKIQNIRYVFSHDIQMHLNALMAAPNSEYDLGDVKIKTLRSTDEGVAFLIEMDGLKIYHAGDLNWWHWEGEDPDWNAEMAQNYKNEIDKIKDEKIDIAFIPVDPRLEESMLWGIEYFKKQVETRLTIPMHYGNAGRIVESTLGSSKQLNAYYIASPMKRGEMLEWRE